MIYRNDLDAIQESENVTIGAASVQSTAAPLGTTHVRLATTGACHVRYDSANPTATVVSLLLPANSSHVFKMPATFKVAVIQDAASTGICNITFVRK